MPHTKQVRSNAACWWRHERGVPLHTFLHRVLRQKSRLPYIGWSNTLHVTTAVRVIVVCCFGKVRCDKKAQVCVHRRGIHGETVCAKLVTKQCRQLSRRMLAHRDGNKLICFIPEQRAVVGCMFSTEAAIMTALAQDGRCWSRHVPRLVSCDVHGKDDVGYITMSHEGVTLEEWSHAATTTEFAVAVFHIAAALHSLQRHHKFRHGDLHVRNVVMQKCMAPRGAKHQVCQYIIDGMSYRVPNIGSVARMIDFQRSSLEVYTGEGESVTITRANMLMKLRKTPSRTTVGQDMQTFLTSALKNPRVNARHTVSIHKFLQALNVPESPSVGFVSAVRPRTFLMRCFAGQGPHAVKKFRVTRCDSSPVAMACCSPRHLSLPATPDPARKEHST